MTEHFKMKGEREQTTIRLSIELKERIQKEADDVGISFNAMVIVLIKKALDEGEVN